MLVQFCRYSLPVAIIVMGLSAYRIAFHSSEDEKVEHSEQPHQVKPLHNDPRLVSDVQLRQVLQRVRPPKGKVVSNVWLHAWRLWGSNAHFADTAIPSGSIMRDYFLDDREYRKHHRPGTPPLMTRNEDGVAVRSYDDNFAHRTSASFHNDDILATFAETGLPLSTRIRLRDGTVSIGELVESSMRSFHLDRHEYEWSLISYARYWFPRPHWQNRYGQKVDLNGVIQELTEHRLDFGPCNGIHRLEALVVLLRVSQFQPDRLSRRNRRRILSHLKRVSLLLSRAQSAEGWWSRNWFKGKEPGSAQVTLADKILVTGHHLEWLALVPVELQPPREQLVRAGQWLARTLLEVDDDHVRRRYGPLTHAARALCLWRGSEAFPAWTRLSISNSSE